MEYQAKELQFYGHETFPLRHLWLPKAINHVKQFNTLTDYEKITPHFERKGQEQIFYNLIRDFNSTNPELEKVNCPFCGKDSPEPAFELESYLYNHCNIL